VSRTTPLLLCVNANPDILVYLKEVFNRENYNVIKAQTYSNALLKAQTGVFDIIIVDVDLPDGSGIELCKEIRMNDRRIPIVFYSLSTKGIDEALNAGANSFLYGPETTALLETVGRFNKQNE
jgi:DNA-binding response OmpR family regulator